MKFLTRFVGLFLVLLVFILKVKAQKLDPTESEKSEKTSYLKIETDYLTNNVFLGRADTVLQPSFAPGIGYYHKSGLYMNATANYLPRNTTSKLDNGAIEIGYTVELTDRLSGSLYFDKLFYSPTSTSIKSSISSTSVISLTYNIADIITPTVELDYNVNKAAIPGDFLMNIGLNHDFIFNPIFGGEDNFTISPALNFNIGTQNFYKNYLQRKFKNKKLQAQETKAIDALAPFQALDYEFSLPISYTSSRFTFSYTPTEAIAVNKLPKAILNTYENATNLFYSTFTLILKF